MTHESQPGEVRFVVFVVLAVAVTVFALLVTALESGGVHVAVIPTITALTIRHFKQKHGDEVGALEPDHPAVKLMFAAWNDGDFSDAEDLIAPNCEILFNGLAVDVDADLDAPTRVQRSVEYWRVAIPDVEMTLLHEVGEKDHIAVKWLISGTHLGDHPDFPATGNVVELNGAVFLTLESKKVVEVSTIVDTLPLVADPGS